MQKKNIVGTSLLMGSLLATGSASVLVGGKIAIDDTRRMTVMAQLPNRVRHGLCHWWFV